MKIDGDIFVAIASCVISVASILFFRYFIPWLNTKVETDKLELIYTIVFNAVNAMEQLYPIKGSGKTKLQEATLEIREWLLKLDVNLSESQIRTLIESAVYDMKQEKKEAEK